MASYFSFITLGLLLPGTMAVYQLVPRRARWAVLLAASYAFFWRVSGMLIVFLVLSTVSIWACGMALDRQIAARAAALRAPGANRRAVKQRYRRRMALVLAAGVALNAEALIMFKYLGFADRLIAPVLGLFGHSGAVLPHSLTHLAAPIGISFYTLQAISYLVDVYRQTITADRNLARLALFLSFFPQIMEGPICRYDQTAHLLWAGNPITVRGVLEGTQRIAWGLAKKLIVADRVNALVKTVFLHYETADGSIIALAGALYVVQLYCDFSGTMDFVVGAGRIFGVPMPENFRQPFFSRTGSEFWQRWHITLGTWFRDYVFYPISLSAPVKRLTLSARRRLGNRMGPVVASGAALFAVWLGNGLWHGAGGQYVLFGLFWFAVIWTGGLIEPFAQSLAERCGIDRAGLPYRAMQHVRTLAVVCVGEVIFRAHGGKAAIGMLGRLVTAFNPQALWDGTALGLGMDAADFACVGVAVAALFLVGLVREHGKPAHANEGARGAGEAVQGAGAQVSGGAGAGAQTLAYGGDGPAPQPILLVRIPRALYAWFSLPAARWACACTLLFAALIFGAYGVGYVPVDPMYASF